MKMVFIVVQDDDVQKLLKELVKEDFRVTKLSSTGGFLRRGSTTVFLGIEDSELEKLKSVIAKNCKMRTEVMPSIPVISQGILSTSEPIEINVGGAVMFVINLEELVKF